jgi:hypothetical protein
MSGIGREEGWHTTSIKFPLYWGRCIWLCLVLIGGHLCFADTDVCTLLPMGTCYLAWVVLVLDILW